MAPHLTSCLFTLEFLKALSLGGGCSLFMSMTSPWSSCLMELCHFMQMTSFFTAQFTHMTTIMICKAMSTISVLGLMIITWNLMPPNVSYMIISRKKQPITPNSESPPLINNCCLERVNSYKYLCLWITSTLNWSTHISEQVQGDRLASSIASFTAMQAAQPCCSSI